MTIAVTSTIVFEVPAGTDVASVREQFLNAHMLAIGRPMETQTGQRYVLRAIERLDVVERVRTS